MRHDAEAAVRLVEVFSSTHDVGVDTGPLEAFAADTEQHFRELAERMERAADESIPDDRMYM